MAAAETGGVGLVPAEQSVADPDGSAASPEAGSGSENPAADLGDGGQPETASPERSDSASETRAKGSNPRSESVSLADPESASIVKNDGGVDNPAADLDDEDGQEVGMVSPPRTASASQSLPSPPRTAGSVNNPGQVKGAAFDLAFRPEEQVGNYDVSSEANIFEICFHIFGIHFVHCIQEEARRAEIKSKERRNKIILAVGIGLIVLIIIIIIIAAAASGGEEEEAPKPGKFTLLKNISPYS